MNLIFGRFDVDEFAEVKLTVKAADFFRREFHRTNRYGVQRIIRSNADIFTGMPFGAALANQNRAWFGCLAAE